VEGACGMRLDESGSWLSHVPIVGFEREGCSRETASGTVGIL
jgi:hypothetical protein